MGISIRYVVHSRDIFACEVRGSRVVDNAGRGWYHAFCMSNSNHESAPNPNPGSIDGVNHAIAFISRWVGVASIGLMEGSLLAQKLCYPTGYGQLAVVEARAGRWVGYNTFGDEAPEAKTRSRVTDGRLAAFILGSIADNAADTRTPAGLASPLNLEAMTYGNPRCSLNELLAAAFVRKTTYGEAFERLKLERHQAALVTHGIADSVIHEVTPKGNGLVFLKTETSRPTRKWRLGSKDMLPRGILLPGYS